jgi:hypothetical protein
MARKAPWWRRLANIVGKVLGNIADSLTDSPDTFPPEPPPRITREKIQPPRNEPPPRRPADRPLEFGYDDNTSYSDLERSALARIDSFKLDELPDRVSVDKYGKEHVYEAEYNREGVWERLQELLRIQLQEIIEMDRDEFRVWCVMNGFFYH